LRKTGGEQRIERYSQSRFIKNNRSSSVVEMNPNNKGKVFSLSK
jgi:hypothetical protein